MLVVFCLFVVFNVVILLFRLLCCVLCLDFKINDFLDLISVCSWWFEFLCNLFLLVLVLCFNFVLGSLDVMVRFFFNCVKIVLFLFLILFLINLMVVFDFIWMWICVLFFFLWLIIVIGFLDINERMKVIKIIFRKIKIKIYF